MCMDLAERLARPSLFVSACVDYAATAIFCLCYIYVYIYNGQTESACAAVCAEIVKQTSVRRTDKGLRTVVTFYGSARSPLLQSGACCEEGDVGAR